MTHFVIYEDSADDINVDELLRYLAGDVESVASHLAPVDEGDLAASIEAQEPIGDSVRVNVGGAGKVTGKPVDYPVFVEEGTSKMEAQPYMKPALFRYRTPR